MSELYHHGVKGMKWGVRRYQNKDGTLTEEGIKRQRYLDVDPEMAKNKQTKRAAYDYHNKSELGFRAKYKTTKKKFAKRYLKTKGDTYSLGKKKALIAAAFLASQPTRSITYGVNKKFYISGKEAAARSLALDFGASIVGTNLGYKRAEKKYEGNKFYE